MLKQSLQLTLHRCPSRNDESLRSSNDTGHPAGFGTICHGNGLLLALFESLIEEQSGLLLLYRLIGLARKTLTLHSSSASQDTVDQALGT